jgi:hypothetical protein
MKHYIIYKTTNNINNKIYIGKHQTNNLDDGYLGSGKYLKNAIKKYGKENFTREILHYCTSLEELNEKEAEIVNASFVLRDDTYNLALGGEGGNKYIPEELQKSEQIIIRVNSNTKKKYQELSKQMNVAEYFRNSIDMLYQKTKNDDIDEDNFARIVEWHKCKNDIIYFIETYCKDVTFDGLQLHKLYPKQKECIEAYLSSNNVVVNGVRQSGKSFLNLVYTCWLLCFHKDKQIVFISKSYNTDASRFRAILENLPEWMQPKYMKYNMHHIQTITGSSIIFTYYSCCSTRARLVNVLVLDEPVWVDQNELENLWAAALPIVSQVDGQVILSSTCNYTGDLFHKCYTSDIFTSIDITCDDIGRDEKWIKKQREFFKPHDFSIEYTCTFRDKDEI